MKTFIRGLKLLGSYFNGFPSHMFDRIVRRFLDHTFDPKPPVQIVPKKIVYFCLQCCSASYVGQTTRHLHARISEHLGISPVTGKHSTNPAISSIVSHINASGHPASFDNLQIVSFSSDSYELMMH